MVLNSGVREIFSDIIELQLDENYCLLQNKLFESLLYKH